LRGQVPRPSNCSKPKIGRSLQEDANLLRVEGEELTIMINILATLLIFSSERRAW
jgi:hypothetical protein